MAKKSLFDTLYSQLNTEQKKAVDTVEGPVMVVAGPGTGKTYILTLRIAKILKETDIESENILALTFTEAASQEMRERLVAMMGAEAYRVGIFTFHGFCNDIIQRNSDEFPDIIGAVHITDIEQVERVKEILEDSVFSLLRPFGNPSYYVRPLLRRVSDLKRAGISTEEFAKHIAEQKEEFKQLTKGTKRTGKEESLEKQIARNKELALFYEKYQKMLHSSLLYDYDDMILKVVEVLSGRGELLISLQEQYLYLLADEHQDVNYAQNTVLELLSSFHKSPNLFIVGDEKQAIFRFQGASRENFLYFKNLYKKVKVINLKSNYRSTQTILNVADNIISSEVSLSAKAGHKEALISVFPFSSLEAEQYFLAKNILENISYLAARTGIFVEPAGATSVAGLRQLAANGKIKDIREQAVCLLTGNGLKDVDAVLKKNE
ncbi:UvrD-helicase domain-containing protein [Patescibacteria group bacterium]|nr:UvrD-helicase domain-containing protein [Patescibacteria group bacterium]